MLPHQKGGVWNWRTGVSFGIILLMKGIGRMSANENQIVAYQPNETVRLDVLNDHEYGGLLSAIGRSNDEIGPKVFREYFRV